MNQIAGVSAPPASPSMQQLLDAAGKAYGSGNMPLAGELARLVLRQDPNHGFALSLLATVIVRSGRDRAAALDYARRATEAVPNFALAQCAMGMACRDLGLLPEAVKHLRNAVALAPKDTEISRQLGMTLVQARSWREGWPYYEYRPTTRYANELQKPDPEGISEWRGEDLAGKTLIVLGENGHGDQIQCARFVYKLLELPLRQLIICVRPALVTLVEHSLKHYPGGERAVLLRESTVDGVEYWVSTESLPYRFGADETTLPGRIPYLFAPGLSAGSTSRDAAIRVGVVWRGERRLMTNPIRSIPLGDLRALTEARPQVRWISLQLDDYDADETALLAQYGFELPLRRDFDFLQTAAIINDLDLVISVDTAMAHLPGALGKPVWLLNRASSEWRWGWKRTESPWYPTMRIFNQETLFKWQSVLEEVKAALPVFLQSGYQP